MYSFLILDEKNRRTKTAFSSRAFPQRAQASARETPLQHIRIYHKILILKRKREPAVSRVLSWAIIHLGQPLPAASSNLPGSPLRPRSGRNCPTAPLFGLAPSGVCLAAACCHPRGALLPHHFTLTSRRPAVYFLWHFPWARALQALPGALPVSYTHLTLPTNREV